MIYIHLPKNSNTPELSMVAPYKAIVIIDDVDVESNWQNKISKWMIDTGCFYMMAWGHGCSSWDDSVDFANLEIFDYKKVPDDKLVMTTWHENDTMDHVFWFCEHCAHHEMLDTTETVIIDITTIERQEVIKKRFLAAQQGED